VTVLRRSTRRYRTGGSASGSVKDRYAGLLGDGTVLGDQQSQAREASSVCPVAALGIQP
jgi:hypothetical protein